MRLVRATENCLDRTMLFHKWPPFGRSIACGFLFIASASGAQEVLQLHAEIRSFLGQPLNVRIAIADARGVTAEAGCFSLVDTNIGDATVRSNDVRLAIIADRGNRYLQIRSKKAFDEPIAQFTVGIACPGTAATTRDYAVLVDPLPFSVTPSAPATSVVASSKPRLPSRAGKKSTPAYAAANGMWTVRAGDTLMAYARAIYPDHPARQQQYVEALRELNPAVARDRKSTRLNSSHGGISRMPSSA